MPVGWHVRGLPVLVIYWKRNLWRNMSIELPKEGTIVSPFHDDKPGRQPHLACLLTLNP